jgi:hypothetical protein
MAGLIKDYLSVVSPDYSTTTLNVIPQNVVVEQFDKVQEVLELDDENVFVITYSNTPKIKVTLQWSEWLSSTDAATLIDFWADTSKANGRARTFKWPHPTDGYTYVARFLSDISRTLNRPYTVPQVTLLIEGYVSGS